MVFFSEMLCFAGVLYLIGLSWVCVGFGCFATVCVGFRVGVSLFWVGWWFTYLGFLFLLQEVVVIYIGLFIVDWFGLVVCCDWLGLFVCLFGLWWLGCLWVCWFVVLVVGLRWLLCVFVWIGFVSFDFDCLGLFLLVDLGLSVWVGCLFVVIVVGLVVVYIWRYVLLH